jgi:hypothetical protein
MLFRDMHSLRALLPVVDRRARHHRPRFVAIIDQPRAKRAAIAQERAIKPV